MKTEAYVDRSLDDFIKANRGMFRRGRGGAPGRGATSRRGGRAQSRGGARGARSPLRGGGRGRSNSRGRGRAGTSATYRAPARGRARGRGAGRTQRGGTQGGSFSRTWRASSAKMASRMRGGARATQSAASSPLRRKTATLKTVKGSKLAGRLGTQPKGVKRVTTLALKKKRKAMQQLTSPSKQLARSDARNRIMMQRRGIKETAVTSGRPRRGRGAASSSRAPLQPKAARVAQSRQSVGQTQSRTQPKGRPQPGTGRVQVFHEPTRAASSRGRGRRPLNRTRMPPADPNSLLTVQIKNDLAMRQQPRSRRAPPTLDMDVSMEEYAPSPPPPPPPPPQPRSQGALDPRIQQEIAAIQARGRQQHHHLSSERQSSGLSSFRPTANVSSRTLNDRFTSDRVIYS